VESDNLAEHEISAVNFDRIRDAAETTAHDVTSTDDKETDPLLLSLLELAAVDVYENRLKSRWRKKRIVRELGLLNKTRIGSRQSQYHRLFVKRGSPYERLFKLGRLVCSLDFDYMMESLQYEVGLRHNVVVLQDYRHNGLRKFAGTDYFKKLNRTREDGARELSVDTVRDFGAILSAASCATVGTYVKDRSTGKLVPAAIANGVAVIRAASVGGSSGGVLAPASCISSNRRHAGPLDIAGYPGYEKLSGEERKLCSEVR
jgi:hypothetical protein